MPTPADPLGLADPGASAGSLAARQLALVSALVAGAEPPAGMARERVHVQAHALLRKRARSVARHQPDLSASLGDGFWPAFEQYAAQSAPPAGSAADAQAFASYIRKTRRRPLFRRYKTPRHGADW
jgi:hypothetical protein